MGFDSRLYKGRLRRVAPSFLDVMFKIKNYEDIFSQSTSQFVSYFLLGS